MTVSGKISPGETLTFNVPFDLSETLGKLSAARFVRIHKSYAAAVSKIDRIGRAEVTIGGKTLPVSASYREELLRRLTEREF